MRLDLRLLGWGTFFILLGAIPLAVQQGYLDKELVSRWFSLWPLLLIGWGLGLVLRETPIDWLGGAVTTLTFGVMGGSLIAGGLGGIPFSIGCGDEPGQPFVQPVGSLDDGSSVSVTLPCGELTIAGVDGAAWSFSGTAGDDGPPVVRATDGGLEISGPAERGFGSDGRTSWDLSLPRDPADLKLSLTLNAGEGRVDLAGLQLGAVGFTLNAGQLRIDGAEVATLGSLEGTINAGSATVSLPLDGRGGYTVNAGSLTVCVPGDAAVRVEASGALGANNLDSIGFENVGEDTWQSAGFETADVKVDLQVTTNAGSFELVVGGTCDA